MSSASSAIRCYLDLNHWIHFSQARAGHSGGASHTQALNVLRQALAEARIVIPLSAAHYAEVRKIKNFDQRNNLALTMAELSRYQTLVNRSVMRRAELITALAGHFGVPTSAEVPPVIGYGFAHAYGWVYRGGHIDGADLVSRAAWAAAAPKMIAELERLVGGGWHFDSPTADPLERFTAACNEILQFVQLRGPRPGTEEQQLRTKYGYNPEELDDGIKEKVARHERIVAELEKRPKYKRRYEDLLGAYAYVWELVDDLVPALKAVGHTLDDLVHDGTLAMTAVLERMPTIQTDAALRGGNLRNLERPWRPNDLYDLEHLSVSAAYCDVVITEKHAATLLNRVGIGERYGTLITHHINDLVARLT